MSLRSALPAAGAQPRSRRRPASPQSPGYNVAVVGAAHFLKELVVVLGTAALTSVVFQRLRQPVVLGYILAGLVSAILVVEDMIAILLLALFSGASGVASNAGLSGGALALAAARLGGFLVAMLVVGLFVVPRVIRLIVRLQRPETLLIASM